MSVEAMEATQIPAGAATAAIPRHIRELFGEPPLLRSESRDAYDALWSALVVQFDPREIMEWAWVRDLADLTWEVARMRRAVTSMLNVSFKSGLRGTLREVIPFVATMPPESEVLAEAWYDASSGKGKVAATLAKYGLGAEAAEGEAFARRLGDVERMQRLIISAESRRNMIIRELQVHRESALARKACSAIIDAEPANPAGDQGHF
ncbi:MAG: hypothetical protein ACLPKB_02060 [Xanthobacteraceae bacterium]